MSVKYRVINTRTDRKVHGSPTFSSPSAAHKWMDKQQDPEVHYWSLDRLQVSKPKPKNKNKKKTA